MALTVRRIEKLIEPGRHLDERGLYLQVRSESSKSWLLRYERDGRERWMGLGSLQDFNLDEARERARLARQKLRDGRDPLDERREHRRAAKNEEAAQRARAKTFSDAAEEYFAHHHHKWRNDKHRAQFVATLKQYAYPVFGHLPVANVDRVMVLKVLEPIWTTKPETASRVRGRIEAVLSFSTVREYRSGENPARWKGHLDQVLASKASVRKVAHHRAMLFTDIPAFVTELRQRRGTAAKALEFLILTASRTAEVTGSTWTEFDLENKIWTVPAERMKAYREHRVPLSDAAIALLIALPREAGNQYAFLGSRRGGLSNMAMGVLLRRMGYEGRATVHGFRSTFRDWAAETTNHANHVAEAALAHVVGDKVEAAYRRGDLIEKRRIMMAEWALFCHSP